MNQDASATPAKGNIGDQPKPDPAILEAVGNLRPSAVDLEKLNVNLTPSVSARIAPVPTLDASGGLLGELVEDMVDVLRRLQGIEESVGRLGARIDQVDARVYEGTRSLSAEVAAQRRDLIGDRKGLLARGLFNAVVGHLDSLRAIRWALQEGKERNDKHNKRMVKQIEAIEITLVTALQGMGFSEFVVRPGDTFSPTTMECLGYVKGESGIVLQAVRSGFAAQEGVARPAGVYIAEPLKISSAQIHPTKET